jgi:hypothetical protein
LSLDLAISSNNFSASATVAPFWKASSISALLVAASAFNFLIVSCFCFSNALSP